MLTWNSIHLRAFNNLCTFKHEASNICPPLEGTSSAYFLPGASRKSAFLTSLPSRCILSLDQLDRVMEDPLTHILFMADWPIYKTVINLYSDSSKLCHERPWQTLTPCQKMLTHDIKLSTHPSLLLVVSSFPLKIPFFSFGYCQLFNIFRHSVTHYDYS